MKILEVKNLSFSAGNKLILKDVNLSICRGEYVLLSGLNGSGKSTFLKILANNIDSKQYTNFKVDGHILDKNDCDVLEDKNREVFGKTICYVPQEDCFVGSTILEELKITLSFSGFKVNNNEIIKLLERLQLSKALLSIDESVTEIGKILKLKPEKLSGGQKKLVSIISAVVKCEQADICLIDEPLNNLDIKHVRAICNLLTYINRNLGKAIILVSHCRVFPNISAEYMFENGQIIRQEKQNCYACFGKPDEQGYYDL